MKPFNKIELQNLFLDLVITFIAFKFIDISGFVKGTLQWLIYIIIAVQSFALFLLYSDYKIDKIEENTSRDLSERIKTSIEIWLRGFIMFSWAIGFIWIFLPIDYLKVQTGLEFVWAARISFFVGLFNGIILLVRFFANYESGERETISNFWNRPYKNKTWAEIIIIPIYEFLFYTNIATGKIRYWMAYAVTFAYLIYTETLFDIMVSENSVSIPLVILAFAISYLPIRMLLLIRPPFSFIELISAFSAFLIILYTLFF